jgi:hypothetical protein
MNRKVVLGEDDPRRVSSVLLTAPSVFLYYLFSQNKYIPPPNNYVSELNKRQENNTEVLWKNKQFLPIAIHLLCCSLSSPVVVEETTTKNPNQAIQFRSEDNNSDFAIS